MERTKVDPQRKIKAAEKEEKRKTNGVRFKAKL
jgi:hypothetical protein